MTSNPLIQLRPLLDGAASGIYTLPAEVLELRAGIDALAAQPAPTLTEDAVRDQLTAATVAAARRGEPLPDLTPLLDARRADELERARQGIVVDAEDRARAQLGTAVAELADTIITEHLRPVVEDVIAKARRQVDAFGTHGASPGELFSAPPKVRQAYTDFTAGVHRYEVVRAGRSVLARVGSQPVRDDRGWFGEVRNADVLWPDMAAGLKTDRARPPWFGLPTEQRLLWFVEHRADVWLPTPAEQDARWREVLGEQYDEQRRLRAAYAAASAMST